MEGNKKKWKIGLLLFGMISPWLLSGPVYAQSSGVSKPPQAVKPGVKEKRIIILGTTIMGSVARPRVVYEVPWKEPESFKKSLEDPQRSFQGEIFRLLDKEQFETEMQQNNK